MPVIEHKYMGAQISRSHLKFVVERKIELTTIEINDDKGTMYAMYILRDAVEIKYYQNS
jgi:hypothetical protein